MTSTTHLDGRTVRSYAIDMRGILAVLTVFAIAVAVGCGNVNLVMRKPATREPVKQGPPNYAGPSSWTDKGAKGTAAKIDVEWLRKNIVGGEFQLLVENVGAVARSIKVRCEITDNGVVVANGMNIIYRDEAPIEPGYKQRLKVTLISDALDFDKEFRYRCYATPEPMLGTLFSP